MTFSLLNTSKVRSTNRAAAVRSRISTVTRHRRRHRVDDIAIPDRNNRLSSSVRGHGDEIIVTNSRIVAGDFGDKSRSSPISERLTMTCACVNRDRFESDS